MAAEIAIKRSFNSNYDSNASRMILIGKLFLLFSLFVSFRLLDEFLRSQSFPTFGEIQILFFLIIFTYLLYRQIYRFRMLIKEITFNRILNEEYWHASRLRGNILSHLLALIISPVFATSLMAFLYLADRVVFLLLFIDIFVFIYIDRKLCINFEKYLNKDVAKLFYEYAPLAVNTFFLVMVYVLIKLFDNSIVFEAGSSEIPIYVAKNVHHSCQFFRWLIRTQSYIELLISSLRNLESIGWYFYVTMLVSTVSVIPFSAVSFLLKSISNTAPLIRKEKQSEPPT